MALFIINALICLLTYLRECDDKVYRETKILTDISDVEYHDLPSTCIFFVFESTSSHVIHVISSL